MKPPPVQFAGSPGSQIAYQVVGDGPIDLLFHPGPRNLDAIWENPALDRFLRRLASSRVVLPAHHVQPPWNGVVRPDADGCSSHDRGMGNGLDVGTRRGGGGACCL